MGARETLRSASFDGTLERALSTDLEEEAEDRRLRARRALENLVDSNGPDIVEALDTGSLAMALQVHERQQDQQDSLDPDFLRMQARRALGSISSQDIEGVCQKAIEMSTGT